MVTSGERNVKAGRKPLYVSLIIGGSSEENASAIAAVRALGRISDETSPPAAPDGLNVDLTFHVPGPIVQPDYQGVRTGRYVRGKHLLVVQAAVPVPLQPDRAVSYMAEVLETTSRVARDYVRRKELALSTEAVERVIGETLMRLSKTKLD